MAGQMGTPSEPTQRSPGSMPSSTGPGMTGRVQDTASRVVDKVRETASRMVGDMHETAAPAMDQVGEKREEVMEQAAEQVSSRLDMGKDYAAETLTGIAHALRQTGQQLRQEGVQPMFGEYAETGAAQLERLSGHLRQRDANELLAEVEWFARRSPTLFAGGAFALGLLAARFFRSSSGPSKTQQFAPAYRPTTGMHSGQSMARTQTTPTPSYAAGTSPSYPSSAPSARNIPASTDWTPPAPSRPSSGVGTGTDDADSERLTPIPGSLSAPGRSTPGTGTGTGTGTSRTTSRPRPTGGTTGTPGTERPAPGGQREA